MKKHSLVFLAALFTFSIVNAQKADLSLNLEKGKEYVQRLNSMSDIIQNYNGMEMNIELMVESDISYTVNDIVDDNYNMSVEYTRMNMTMSTPMGASEFSSESEDEGDIVSSILKEMLNKPFTIVMSRSGKVVEVKDIDAMYGSAFEKLSSMPSQQQQQMESQLKQAFGKDAFKGNIEMVMSIFPENKVSVGETWTEKTRIETGMSANVISTYKLAEIASDYILITGESDLKSEKDEFIETNGVPVKYDLNGTIISQVKVDPKTRWIKEANVEQNIEGQLLIKANPQTEEVMEIPMKMKNVIVIVGE